MASLKYTETYNVLVRRFLTDAEEDLQNAMSEVSAYKESLPNFSVISDRINEMATRKNADGEEEVDQSLRNHYLNDYGFPLSSARSNMGTIQMSINALNQRVADIDDRLIQVGEKIAEFESQGGKLGVESNIPIEETPVEGMSPFENYEDGGGGETPTHPGLEDLNNDDGQGDDTPDTPGVDPSNPVVNPDDGKANLNIDTDGDGIPDLNIDTDGDGKPDLNVDTNGDGIPDLNIDTDGDGKPNLNVDTDGDGIPDLNIDTNGDGKPDLSIDKNGDGVPDVNVDTTGDGKPDLNVDTNGDGIPDVNVDTNGDGRPDVNIDTNGDGKADINLDADGDGFADTNIDINGDGVPDINVDTDGDGIPDKNVIPGYEHNSGDGSGDGSFLSDLLKRMKLEVDDDGNILYYDENGNIVYPFLGDGIFANPANAQKFKLGENAFLELLDGPEKNGAVKSLDLDLDEDVSSATFAVGGMAAVGAAAANAASTMKRTKDEIKDGYRAYEYDYDYDDDAKLTDEQYKKRKNGTIVSMILLTLLIVANVVALILDVTSDVTIVLMGLAISITAIITSMGIKLGKFYTVVAMLVNLLAVFIVTSLDLTGDLGYIISYAAIIVVLLYYYFTKTFERILPMFNYVPAVVAVVGIGFVGLTNVFVITNWWISLILVILIIIGYFAYNYYGIDKLEEQMELGKKRGLNVYDYFNLKTNKIQWNSGSKTTNNMNVSNKGNNRFVEKESNEYKNDIKDFFK